METIERLQFYYFIRNLISYVNGSLQRIHYVPNHLQSTTVAFQNYFPGLEYLESITCHYKNNSRLRIPVSFSHFEVLFFKEM